MNAVGCLLLLSTVTISMTSSASVATSQGTGDMASFVTAVVQTEILDATIGKVTLSVPKEYVTWYQPETGPGYLKLFFYWRSRHSLKSRTEPEREELVILDIEGAVGSFGSPFPQATPIAPSGISRKVLVYPHSIGSKVESYRAIDVAPNGIKNIPVEFYCSFPNGLCRAYIQNLPGLHMLVDFQRSQLQSVDKLLSAVMTLVKVLLQIAT